MVPGLDCKNWLATPLATIFRLLNHLCAYSFSVLLKLGLIEGGGGYLLEIGGLTKFVDLWKFTIIFFSYYRRVKLLPKACQDGRTKTSRNFNSFYEYKKTAQFMTRYANTKVFVM